jgi:hypothetical protein
MSNRTDPQQNISGMKGPPATPTLVAWTPAATVLAPPVNNTTTVPVTAPTVT